MNQTTNTPNAFTSSELLQCDVSGATSPTTRTKGTRGGSEPRDGVLQEIGGVNAMPAATWGWLKMNQTKLELSDELAAAPAEAVEVEGLEEQFAGTADAFDTAMDAMAERFPEHRASAPGDAADRARITPETELDVPATSVYQAGAIKLEEELSPAEAFETGMGEAACTYLIDHATKCIVIDVPAYQHATVTVRVSGADAAAAIAAIDIVARPQATLDLALALDSPVNGQGVVGSVLRVCAHEYATVNVTCTQTLDDSWIALDDTGLFLDEGAHVNVQHTVLGAGASATGLAGDLLGDTAKVTIDTDYLGAREQVRDFNYELRHRGRKTECEIDANGVLTGTSKKVYRGTIDLVHGCKGATGTERETVLLASKGVDNKTVPVILCDEDDVAGNHGATIGHVRDEQLFYLACRGLDQNAAEDLFIRAKLEDAALSATDERTRAAVVRLGNNLIDNFEEEFA